MTILLDHRQAVTVEYAALRAGAVADGAFVATLSDAYLRTDTAQVLGEVPEDEPPESVPSRVQRGEVWQLGRHRLMCGDSTDAEAVARLMDGALADIVFTSPPYDQQRDYGAKIHDWQGLMRGVFAALPAKHETQVLVNLGLVHRDGEWQPYWDPWIEWMREQGWRRFGWYVWDKVSPPPQVEHGRLTPGHEWVFHFARTTHAANKIIPCVTAGKIHGAGAGMMRAADGSFVGGCAGEAVQCAKFQYSVLSVAARVPASGHPAAFPAGLAAKIYASWGDSGDVAYEPFCGSGTSIIAGEHTGRVVYGMELEPSYCDIALARWEKFTGQEARKC